MFKKSKDMTVPYSVIDEIVTLKLRYRHLHLDSVISYIETEKVLCNSIRLSYLLRDICYQADMQISLLKQTISNHELLEKQRLEAQNGQFSIGTEVEYLGHQAIVTGKSENHINLYIKGKDITDSKSTIKVPMSQIKLIKALSESELTLRNE